MKQGLSILPARISLPTLLVIALQTAQRPFSRHAEQQRAVNNPAHTLVHKASGSSPPR